VAYLPPRGPERNDVKASSAKPSGESPKAGGAESGAESAEKASKDADLAKVIEAWPGLHEAVRAGILAMVEAAKPK